MMEQPQYPGRAGLRTIGAWVGKHFAPGMTLCSHHLETFGGGRPEAAGNGTVVGRKRAGIGAASAK